MMRPLAHALAHQIDAASLAALPRTAGVYIFKGQGQLPLYIGKSVDIRSRVMSHLRAPDEVAMVAQTRRIDFIETAGEIGALLLESRMIKEQMPLFNQRLRRIKTLCSLRLTHTEDGLIPEVVDSRQVNFGVTRGLYGLFSSAHAASAKLRELAQQHRLCLSLLGLERASQRGCFGWQIKTCLGACVGKENRAAHDQRLLSALLDSQVEVWPFQGAIEVVERSADWVQRHRVNNWGYLGTACSKAHPSDAWGLIQNQGFDLDSYKILVKPIMLKTVEIQIVDV